MKRYVLSYADWSHAEYAQALRSLARRQVADGENVAALTACLSERYRPSAVYPMNFGHSAIHIALDIFRQKIDGRDEVIIPAYICPSVTNTIRAIGLKPRFAAIGDDLNIFPDAVKQAVNGQTLAVIVPHMYGCPAKVAEIERLCRSRGVFMIDDAAQVVGRACSGRQLGTFGDFGILSFAQSKTVVTGVGGSGGVLLVNNTTLEDDVSKICRNLPPARQRGSALADFLWNYVWGRYTRQSGYYFKRILHAIGARPESIDCPAQISNLDAGIALAQISRLSSIHLRRIEIADIYHRTVAHMPDIRFPQYSPGRYLARVVLLLPPHADAASVRVQLSRAGIETRVGYQTADSAGPDAEGAHAISRRLIDVPSGRTISEKDVRYICMTLQKTVQSYSSVGNSYHETYQTFH